MSGHCWALDIPRASKGTGPGADGKIGFGSMNLAPFDGTFSERATAWALENQHLDDKFDGFVVTYPPYFVLLYEKFTKPIILVLPVRCDLGLTPDITPVFYERLKKLHDSGRLIVVANNKYDAAYYEYFTGRPALHISSTCDYIDRFAPKWHHPDGPPIWSPSGRTPFLSFGEVAACRAVADAVSEVGFVRDALGERYLYKHVISARGIVWIPYNCSVMSHCEHQWLNIPIFVPTKRFLRELWKQNLALSQIGSFPWREDFWSWAMDLYDFYDAEFYVTLFDSWEQLKQIIDLNNSAMRLLSERMTKRNVDRRKINLNKWAGVLAPLSK